MSTDLTGLIPHGWSGGEHITKWWRGKFIHLYRLRKNCAQCGKEMSLDVTKAAIMGEAKNAGLHLVRCPECRAKTPRDITSRPSVRDDGPLEVTERFDAPAADVSDEVEMLRAQNEAFLRSVQALQTELQAAKAKLAKYELAPAMAVQAKLPSEPLTMAQSTELLLKATQNKMPWEG